MHSRVSTTDWLAPTLNQWNLKRQTLIKPPWWHQKFGKHSEDCCYGSEAWGVWGEPREEGASCVKAVPYKWRGDKDSELTQSTLNWSTLLQQQQRNRSGEFRINYKRVSGIEAALLVFMPPMSISTTVQQTRRRLGLHYGSHQPRNAS